MDADHQTSNAEDTEIENEVAPFYAEGLADTTMELVELHPNCVNRIFSNLETTDGAMLGTYQEVKSSLEALVESFREEAKFLVLEVDIRDTPENVGVCKIRWLVKKEVRKVMMVSMEELAKIVLAFTGWHIEKVSLSCEGSREDLRTLAFLEMIKIAGLTSNCLNLLCTEQYYLFDILCELNSFGFEVAVFDPNLENVPFELKYVKARTAFYRGPITLGMLTCSQVPSPEIGCASEFIALYALDHPDDPLKCPGWQTLNVPQWNPTASRIRTRDEVKASYQKFREDQERQRALQAQAQASSLAASEQQGSSRQYNHSL